MRSWLLVPLAALVLAGCGSQTATAPESPSAAPSVPSACPTAAELGLSGAGRPGTVPLAEDVTVSAAVECSVEDRPVAGDGVWSFVVEKRAGTGPELDRLVMALRGRDEPTPMNLGCDAMLVVVSWFAVVDGEGRWLHPHVPTTACAQPQPAVMDALQALPWTTVSATKVARVTTQAQAEKDAAAQAAGCPTPFKDMIAIEESDTAPANAAGPPRGIDAEGATVCRYVAEVGNGDPTLDFVAGHHATGDQAREITAALAATGRLQACHAQHTTVTVLTASGGDWYLVEDDGCHRVLDGNHTAWGQATPALLAALR